MMMNGVKFPAFSGQPARESMVIGPVRKPTNFDWHLTMPPQPQPDRLEKAPAKTAPPVQFGKGEPPIPPPPAACELIDAALQAVAEKKVTFPNPKDLCPEELERLVVKLNLDGQPYTFEFDQKSRIGRSTATSKWNKSLKNDTTQADLVWHKTMSHSPLWTVTEYELEWKTPGNTTAKSTDPAWTEKADQLFEQLEACYEKARQAAGLPHERAPGEL